MTYRVTKNENEVLKAHLDGLDVFGYSYNEETATYDLMGRWAGDQRYEVAGDRFCLIDCDLFIIKT